MKRKSCKWSYDEDSYCYETQCGRAFVLNNDASLEENHINYCAFCGRKIETQKSPQPN